MAYRNIYASMNPYDTSNNPDGPGGGDNGGGAVDPDHNGADGGPSYWPENGPPTQPPPPNPTPAPQTTTTDPAPALSAVDPGYASATGGPAGVGGTGGYGFTNMAQYMYANPAGQGPGSGYAPTPTGANTADFNSGMHGYAPNGGAYTAGMAGVDNALNQVYQRNASEADKPPQLDPSIDYKQGKSGKRGF